MDIQDSICLLSRSDFITSFPETVVPVIDLPTQLFNDHIYIPNGLAESHPPNATRVDVKKPSKIRRLITRILATITPICKEPKWKIRLKRMIFETPSELTIHLQTCRKLKNKEISFILDYVNSGELDLQEVFPNSKDLLTTIKSVDNAAATFLFNQAFTLHRQIHKKNVQSLTFLEDFLSQKNLENLLDPDEAEQILTDRFSSFNKETFPFHAKDRVLSLASLLYAFKEELSPEKIDSYTLYLPDYAKHYLEILKSSEEIQNIIPQIQELNDSIHSTCSLKKDDFFYAAVAHTINVKKIPISTLLNEKLLDREQLLKLAPFLRYADLRNIYKSTFPHFEKKFIKAAPNLHFLLINSPTISSLPSLKNLRLLDCCGCSNLRKTPRLLKCQQLYCNSCIRLEIIRSLPKCEKLICKDCPSLESIPAMPQCRYLNCSNCPLIRTLEELPSIRTIIRPSNDRVTVSHELASRITRLNPRLFQVETEILNINPKHTLIKLSNYIKRFPSLPGVLYFTNGELSPAIDAGGLRRDFITKLLQLLFFEKGNKKTGLPVVDNMHGKIWPSADIDNEEHKMCYQVIGWIIALCYPPNSELKIGNIFDPTFFEIIKIKDLTSLIPTEKALINSLMILNGLPAEEMLKIAFPVMENTLADLDEELLRNATYFIDPEGIENPRQYFSEPANRLKFKLECLEIAREDKRITAIRIIAQALRYFLGEEDQWNFFSNQTADHLQTQIEGRLSKELLFKQLIWKNNYTDQTSFDLTKKYIETWIENADTETLTRFVQVVTANKTLGPSHQLTIEIFNRDVNNIPNTHTCSSTLEISGNYLSQIDLDTKLETLINEGLAGDGFQVI